MNSKSTKDFKLSTEEFDIIEGIKSSLEASKEKTGKVGILFTGKTGVGKSTLVNAIFGNDVAQTSIGAPVTRGIKTYETETLRLYDTEGLEMLKSQQEDVIKKIKKEVTSDNLHCIVYCVNANSNRFEEFEENFVEEMSELGVPVVVVITQAYNQKISADLKSYIDEKCLDVSDVLLTLALPYQINEDCPTIDAYGVNELVEEIYSIIPEEKKDAFASSQDVSIKLKEKRAYKSVYVAVTAVAGATLTPAVADSILMTTAQFAMIADITRIYGFKSGKRKMVAILTAILGPSIAMTGGKSIFSSLVKLIPGAGQVAGTVIGATVGATLTYAMGKTYIEIMNKIMNGELTEDILDNSKEIKAIFKDRFEYNHKNSKSAVDKILQKKTEENA